MPVGMNTEDMMWAVSNHSLCVSPNNNTIIRMFSDKMQNTCDFLKSWKCL